MKIFCVYDNQAERFGLPMYLPAKGAAVRAFSTACTGGDKQMTACPGDFSLHELGSFDDVSGIITCTPPVRVMTGLEVERK